jgi:hypothetical protein
MSTPLDQAGATGIAAAIAFRPSTRIVDPCRRRTRDGGIASVAHALLAMVPIVMTQGSLAQSSTQAQASTPTSIVSHEEPGGNPRTSFTRGSWDREPTTPCSLRVPDAIPPPAVEGEEATPTTESLAYAPLSARCKFTVFLKSTYSPYTFVSAGFQATESQATGQWPRYGGGMQGWGKRLGATLANTESRRLIQGFALSTILRQDPRYFPSRKRRLISRIWYSATRVVVTKNDSGRSAFNTSEFLGALFSSALQNSYYPRHDRSLGDTMNRFSGALSSDAIEDLLREFTPDMKRLFHKHAPKKILRIEEKLPIPDEDKP